MAEQTYEGEVCYVGHDHPGTDGRMLLGGWHYTVVDGEPGERLSSDGDGGYFLAREADWSHHRRHHKEFKPVIPDLTPEERARLLVMLNGQEGQT